MARSWWTERGAAAPRWHLRSLLLAPHRLGFACAMVVLAASAAWWLLVQVSLWAPSAGLPGWAGGGWGIMYAALPALTHGAVMVFGFMPLFFAGFLFTAGPKWLAQPAPPAARLVAPLAAQVLGWLLWLAGAHLGLAVQLAGLALAWLGLAAVAWRFARLVRASRMADRLHARLLCAALLLGCASLGGLAAALALQAPTVALACVLAGLWGFVAWVFVVVAHRMLPFFSSEAVPALARWHADWVLWLAVGQCLLEALAPWLELTGPWPVWTALRAASECASAAVLLWLALRWGLLQRLRNRLLAMLHLGFVWLGLALLLGGVAQWATLARGEPVLALGQVHALGMGGLGSLMLAMVTRVSCGHSGRAQVADRLVWGLFVLLQLAVLLRLAAALPGTLPARWQAGLPALSAALWAAVMAVWAARLLNWYGRARADGRPG